jgi:hypothetical protein
MSKPLSTSTPNAIATPYQLDFTNASIRNRVSHAVIELCGKFGEGYNEPKHLSSKYLSKHLGSPSNPSSAYLRSVLLIVRDEYYSKIAGVTKQYSLNIIGVMYAFAGVNQGHNLSYSEYRKAYRIFESANPDKTALDFDIEEYLTATQPVVVPIQPKSRNELRKERRIRKMKELPKLKMGKDGILDFDQVIDYLYAQYRDELTSLKFTMREKSNRYWHPIQHVSRMYKPALLARGGLLYEYDIQCCAPTLIYQLAIMCGNKLPLIFIRRYIEFRDKIREDLAKAAGISLKNAKMIVNALFCGAKLGCNSNFAITRALEHDYEKIKLLINEEFLVGLRADIKSCWDTIVAYGHIPRKYRISTRVGREGNIELCAVTSADRWELYFLLEKMILDSVIRFLDATGNKRFTEHDGWTTQKKVDVDALLAHIFKETGFNVKLDEDVHIGSTSSQDFLDIDDMLDELLDGDLIMLEDEDEPVV